MLSIIKADIKKLYYNKGIFMFFLAVIILCGYFLTNNGQIFASNDVTKLGFYYKVFYFENKELLISSVLSYTYLYWILALIFSVFYFNQSKDLIRILISRGKSPVIIGISSWILCNLIVLVGYVIGAFVLSTHIMGEYEILLDGEYVLLLIQMLGLSCMIYIAFVSIIWILCTFLHSPILSFTILFLSTFGTFLVTLMQNNIAGFNLVKLFPMYYFLSLGGIKKNICYEIFLYSASIILITLYFYFCIKKRKSHV